ncbi:HupE/UreJ family protein [Gilvimarinus agarilyticus]|uniref:HupE/UreJ family protein n=1 Tax=Gilvimarinus agarilyticus TaxID=679259 RepID=UPI000697FE43|nr:HupE/UreJ family protein [Gilvimarinus agarilyticus]
MRIVLTLLVLLLSSQALAHQISTGYLTLQPDDQQAGLYSGELQWRLFDLERALGLDQNRDGKLTWAEVQAADNVITPLVMRAFSVRTDDGACDLTMLPTRQIDKHYNEAYLWLPLQVHCESSAPVQITYQGLFDIDPDHKLLLNMVSSDQSSTLSRVLSERSPTADLSFTNSQWPGFVEYVYQGVIHILIGLDHILFLLCLLLGCVLVRRHDHGRSPYWEGQHSKRTILWQTLGVVTAFTLAHSITLTATALDLISLPSHWVEVSIAATVILAALNNVFPLVLRLGWITFGFGLLHGMGFAGVLGELGLPPNGRFLAVLGFNLGVELGQLAIIALVLPVLILVRNSRWYWRYAMPVGSLMIALVGTNWLLERL